MDRLTPLAQSSDQCEPVFETKERERRNGKYRLPPERASASRFQGKCSFKYDVPFHLDFGSLALLLAFSYFANKTASFTAEEGANEKMEFII